MKRVLYVGDDKQRFEALVTAMGGVRGAEAIEVEGYPATRFSGIDIQWVPVWDTEAAESALHLAYVNLLLIDLRWSDDFSARVEETRRLLKALDHADDVEQRYGFHRIVTLLSGPHPDVIDDLIAELGAHGVRHVMREQPESSASEAFSESVLRRVAELTQARRKGKSAICGSGGGITGIYFEMGALKCLDDCLGEPGINDFDMLFGISAGAVVMSLLRVGYTVDEAMAAIAGVEGGRMPPLSLSLLRLSHLNHADLRWRLASAAKTGAWAFWETLRGRGREMADELFLEYTSLVGAPFHSQQFEAMLRELLEGPGLTNDFRELPDELFIGASDQDARYHVLFGSEGYDHVPISRAVQASLSFNPAFASVNIEGRYYEDGAITRTSDFVDAIKRGATLIFVLDPFVPYVSKTPGLAHRRGVLYNIDQDIRTISFTRFERARNSVLRKHPEVSSYTFLPSNTQRRPLSTNPMDHRPYLEIWRGAYLSTLQRIDQLCHRLRGDLIDHGFVIDTTRAEAVAEQLRETRDLSLADFYPDRKIDIKQRPFCMAPQPESAPQHAAQ